MNRPVALPARRCGRGREALSCSARTSLGGSSQPATPGGVLVVPESSNRIVLPAAPPVTWVLASLRFPMRLG